ncbi:hypothetical protein ACH5RR_011256 [Cinchona calisaya]|uniref:DUF4378 domain-containing protein n=1 Tax=Cinchona calisaya TaxID=153742 RepID=A0ABD3A7T2_9GENT
MSAKILPSLTDESRDLQKQIGCMNGIFQLFDRHYFLTGRRSNGHNHKRLLPGTNNNKETNSATNKGTGKIPKEVVQDQPRDSTESLGTSFSSSSCSSTVSFLDHSKAVQCRPPSNPSNFLETQAQIRVKQQTPSLHFSQQSPDLRDVVKESMQREQRGISVKTSVKEGRSCTLKHIDSPRPFQQFKTGQPRVAEFDRPNRIVANLQESPWFSREEKDASLRDLWKDPHRFSYDGRETQNALKSTTKLKELPRLSLDSRETSLRSSTDSRSNFLLSELHRKSGTAGQMVTSTQEPGSNKRPSSVVVKLMGLEAFPESISNDEGDSIKVDSCHGQDFLTRSLKKSEKSKKNPALLQQIVHKDPASPGSKNASFAMKPTSSPRFPLETAPWRQPDAVNDSPRTAPNNWNGRRNATQISTSVYGEIEKRISELEFRKSGKDLRALKQILETMQNTKKRLDNHEGEQTDFKSQTSTCSSDHSCCNHYSTAPRRQSNKNNHLPSTKVTSPPKRFNASIVIAKTDRLMDNSRISSATVVPLDASHLQKLQTCDKLAAKDLTPRKNATQISNLCGSSTDTNTKGKVIKVAQTTRVPQLVKVENYTTFGRSSGTVSPRFQQKNRGIEKQSQLTTPSPDLGKTRRKLTESDSLNRKFRPKSTLHRRKDKLSSTNDGKNCSHQADTSSIQSESNSSIASLTETEVSSTESSTEIKARQLLDQKERNDASRLSEEISLAELTIVPTEQPSPVSVLDATFYREDSPSPVKKKSNVFQDYETANLDEAEWHYLDDEFNQKKLENVKHLVHKLILLSTIPNEASTYQIASLCKTPSPDHKYITKILLASGLLKDISHVSTAIQLHSSGHLINPDLFHVLEQTEQNTMSANEELKKQSVVPLKYDQKIHRKVLFDTVNEILLLKLAPEGPFMQRKRARTGQELLRDLYSEVDSLQAKTDCSLDDIDGFISILNADMMQQPDNWEDYQSKIPAVVLDIERLIFKDLITEVITAESIGLM